MGDKTAAKSIFRFSTKLVFIALVILAVVIVLLSIDFKYQLMQYQEIGTQYTENLWINAYAGIISMIASFIFIFLCIFISNLIINKKLKYFFNEENIKPFKLPNYSLAFIIGIIGAVITKDFLYQNALMFMKATMFYVNDPIFGKDFGYYLFQRPFLEALSDYISGTWLVVIIYTIAYYILAFGSIFNAVAIDSVRKYGVLTHNMINIAIFFLLKTITYNIDAEKILYTKNGSFFGAGFTDVNVWLKAYMAAPFVLAAIVLITLIFLIRNKIKKAVITVLMFPAYWILGLIVAIVVQLIMVAPNELAREKNYIKNSIDLTRYAYNLSDKLSEKEFYVSDSLNQNMLEANQQTIKNITLVDKTAIEESLKQLQEYTGYYQFNDVDITKIDINGNTVPVYAAAREIDKKEIGEKAYANLKNRFTHGYGLVVSPAARVDKEGRPDFVAKDIPQTSLVDGLKINRPQIYFGEMTKDHIVVNLKGSKGIYEIDYPAGNDYKETVYNGKAGVQLTPFNRIMMAIKLGDPRLAISTSIDSQSKVLINRDVVERVRLVAPFLNIDKDPYLVMNKEGKLLWILDGYTQSANFPYSKPIVLEKKQQINYIRNSVKIVIDAYDGTMKFYIVDWMDPIIKTYQKIYPNMFEKVPLPNEIAELVKYPEKILMIQAEILRRYHMADVAQFFNGDDLWSVAVQPGKGKQDTVEPDYLLVKYPDAQKPELVLMVPFTQANRNNLTGWITVRSNLYNYGKITLNKVPRNSLVYGPTQIESYIDQDSEYLKSQAVWTQAGVSVKRGALKLIPLEDESGSTLIYVEPIYVSQDNGPASIPQLKKIAVFYQGKVIIGDTLDIALKKLMSSIPSQASITPESIGNKALLDKLTSVYDEMKDFSAQNDWENFGKKMKELDAIIAEINKRKEDIE